MAEYIQMPRFDAVTPEQQNKQTQEFIYTFIQKYNINLSDLESRLHALEGDHDGRN